MRMIQETLFLDIKISKKEKVNVTEKDSEMGVRRVLVYFIITAYLSLRTPMSRLVSEIIFL